MELAIARAEVGNIVENQKKAEILELENLLNDLFLEQQVIWSLDCCKETMLTSFERCPEELARLIGEPDSSTASVENSFQKLLSSGVEKYKTFVFRLNMNPFFIPVKKALCQKYHSGKPEPEQ